MRKIFWERFDKTPNNLEHLIADDDNFLVLNAGPESDTNIDEWNNWINYNGSVDLEWPAFDENADDLAQSSLKVWPVELDQGQNVVSPAFQRSDNEALFQSVAFEFVPSPKTYDSLSSDSLPSPRELDVHLPQETHNLTCKFTPLSPAQEQALRDIAMPNNRLARLVPLDIVSAQAPQSVILISSSPLPESHKRGTRKRKSLFEEDFQPDLLLCKKRGHNAIEKRYRTNLNDKIDLLREGVPGMRRRASSDSVKRADKSDDDTNNKQGRRGKYGKAMVLTKALEYIKQLQDSSKKLESEVDALTCRVEAFEKLAINSRDTAWTDNPL